MMIGIISDIHGNYPALKAVIEELEKKGISNIICLGDICGYYSQVNECLELVKSLTENIVIGNHDYYIINNENCPRSNSANRCLDYQRKVIKPELLKWLSKKPAQAVYYGINCVHGGWNNYLDEYFDYKMLDSLNIKEKYAVSGHNHIPVVINDANIKYCNPGSVGQPRDGNYKASYAILNNNKDFEIYRVEYDYKETQEHMKKVGFEEYFYKNLEYGLKIGD
ncbi:metallophosphoesterase family protein [Campylobacter lanienae]|uniref:metallophosphoesterase family protein n=1 Tax=Campylobacter lanienae TaxID=75658 RepID=UPI000BB43817|nr:metallophosphoesterase family protein [Campylobacter lanienae]